MARGARRRAAVILLAAGACTDLHMLPIGNPDLPWWDADAEEPRSTDQVDDRTAEGFYLVTRQVPRVADCAAGDDCADPDGDGLVDAWEDLVLDRFRPVVILDEEEPLLHDPSAVVGSVGRVAPAADGSGRVRMYLLLGYSFDYGRCADGSHRGDSERIALDIELVAIEDAPPETTAHVGDPHWAGAWVTRARQVYTAAHEGTASDASWRGDASDVASDTRWTVYAARAKHGTFPYDDVCDDAAAGSCTREDCDIYAFDRTLLFPVVNAGEPDRPRAADLERFAFAGESVWGGREFCGGVDGDEPCTSPIRDKLTDDPF